MTFLRSAIALVLGLSIVSAAFAADWNYALRPGDTLAAVAEKYCGSPEFAARLLTYNGFAAEADIPSGARLRIPVAWLKEEPAVAKVLFVGAEAAMEHSLPTALHPGDEIRIGALIRTGAGFVTVEFADGSVLEIAPHSEVLFNRLSSYGDTGMVDTSVRFNRGRGTARVVRKQYESGFRISTPSGIAAVRGTEFRVGIDGVATATETVEGEVAFADSRQTVNVEAGFGVVATGQPGEKLAAVPLPPAPQWTDTRAAMDVTETLAWHALADATSYRLNVGRADGGNWLERELTETEIALSELGPGHHRVTLRGRVNTGLEGLDAVRTLVVRPLPVENFRVRVTDGGRVASWEAPAGVSQFVLQVSTSETFDEVDWQTVVDDSSLTLPRDATSGRTTTYVRVASLSNDVHSSHRVETLEAPPRPWWLLLLLPLLAAL